MKHFCTLFACLFLFISGYCQLSFSKKTHLLGDSTIASIWMAIGVADVNGDTLDDIIRVDKDFKLSIDFQQSDQSFNHTFYEQLHQDAVLWGIVVADLDHNGINDIYFCENDSGIIYYMDDLGNILDRQLLLRHSYPQGQSFIDINEDGWIDMFECNDTAANLIFVNDKNGNLINIPGVQLGNTAGNYSSVWTDYDLDGDPDLYISKCYQTATSFTDPRRVNQLFRNDGGVVFTEVGSIAGVDDGAQSWSTTAGDIDNDGDYDLFVVNHDKNSKLFINNGSGGFIDMTSSMGLDSISGNIVKFADFNNDTYLDLMIGSPFPRSDINGKLYINNGNNTFTHAVNVVYDTVQNVRSFAVGNLNNDGFEDLILLGGARDELLINDGNANNYLDVLLFGYQSNRNAIGSRIEIYGPWGIQVREVRAGESYGTMNSFTQHFGLGTANLVDSLVVKWISGKTTTLLNVQGGQRLVIKEEEYIGVQENSQLSTPIEIYPNPFNESSTIEINGDYDGRFNLLLYNSTGVIVRNLVIEGTQSTTLLRNDLPSGIYHYQVLSENQLVQKGVLIAK